jgi:hypothetical protein
VACRIESKTSNIAPAFRAGAGGIAVADQFYTPQKTLLFSKRAFAEFYTASY